jgi:ribonuclease E
MLIDARHPEETRVAVLKGNRIEEFDFESADHKQIKGNIYLAKVTRVEPSLQAAFVDFGGNRHGFLAFSEIHPDYYQIPKQDRDALLAEEAAHAAEEAELRAAEEAEEDAREERGEYDEDGHDHRHDDDDDHDDDDHDHGSVTEIDTSEKDEVATIEGGVVEQGFDGDDADDALGSDDDGSDEIDSEDDRSDDGDGAESVNGEQGDNRARRGRGHRPSGRDGGRAQPKEMDELRARRMALRRRYKIQDVIQRRQVLLVQVVKEERGNKGAALTTYLSLAGRYCVLMPNSSHGGGISRKINSAADRKRLKSIMSEMELPRSMSCIVRTAGLSRTKPEIKRDFDYLARLWDEIRDRTLHSSAPALIHSDSDLVKRAIRDIYNRDIEEVVVEGDDGYRAARDFMKLLMPSHARRVKHYADPVPLYQRYGAEDQLSAMYDPVVQLKSGGYLVINPTEALVSIDINSGRSTKEHGIEGTAVGTNLEAAREIARQLRLRDMAGLVVIDFIDMEYGSNVRKVEKAMKDALKNDRARIQVGRISSFGLMEMSRQRLRTGVLEATTRACPHCDGSGLVRTASSAGLSALRMIEDEAAKGRGNIVTLYASQEAAVYVLNAKRHDLAEIEARYGVSVEVIPEGENEGAKMRVGSRGPRPEFVPKFEPIVDLDDDPIEDDFEDEIEEEDVREERSDRNTDRAERPREAEGDGDPRRKRRKRRRGRKDRPEGERAEGEEARTASDEAHDDGEDAEAGDEPSEGGTAVAGTDDEAERAIRKRRRRGRRRRGGAREDGAAGEVREGGEGETGDDGADDTGSDVAPVAAAEPVSEVTGETAKTATKKPRSRRKPKAEAEVEPVEAEAAAPQAIAADTEEPAKPKRTRRKKADAAAGAAPETEAPAEVAAPAAHAEIEDPGKPKRTRARKAAASQAEAPASETAVAEPEDAAEPTAVTAEPESDQPKRGGWWQRTFGA